MREILFRGAFKLKADQTYYKKEEAEFIESKVHEIDSINYLLNSGLPFVSIPYNNRCITLFERHFDKFKLLQFTGLTDKNGVRIFEGDIIEEGYNNMANRWVVRKWIIKWNQIQMSWMGYNDERNPYPTNASIICTNKNVIEVIGNIHDNPELIQ